VNEVIYWKFLFLFDMYACVWFLLLLLYAVFSTILLEWSSESDKNIKFVLVCFQNWVMTFCPSSPMTSRRSTAFLPAELVCLYACLYICYWLKSFESYHDCYVMIVYGDACWYMCIVMCVCTLSFLCWIGLFSKLLIQLSVYDVLFVGAKLLNIFVLDL
jgi:hypothetical protein